MSAQGIGDVTSNEKGSGARYNTGKVALELIPLRIIYEQRQRGALNDPNISPEGALLALAHFQETSDEEFLYDAISLIGPAWDECAAVFTYGQQKYAPFNWAKGMPWSVPLACAARHLVNGILKGEENDSESGLSHRGHFLCNVVMLLTYLHTYQEGNDLPTTLRIP